MIDTEKLSRARLILEDGSIWKGSSFGADGETGGEIVFNTAMSGYQEVLTDPSYNGQVVCMTSPQVGNYGVNPDDVESRDVRVAGFIVRELARRPSSWRSTESLDDYLKRNGIVAIQGLDTRAITRRIREHGAMKVFMTSEPLDDETLRERIGNVPHLVGRDLVSPVARSEAGDWTEGFATSYHPRVGAQKGGSLRVVAFDFGVKETILRILRELDCEVTVVPPQSTAAEILALKPDGVFLSNGPGDPEVLTSTVAQVRELIGKVPLFGICLGHQLISLALGAEVVKLKFGHHGSNHPIQFIDNQKIEITAQNHGFAATRESLEQIGARITHVNLNDGTVAGLEMLDQRCFSVQYHPEASPGPHDSIYLFRRFIALMRGEELGAIA